MPAACAQLSAWQARSGGAASTPERRASPLATAQPGRPQRGSSGGGGRSCSGRLPPYCAVGYDGRQAPPAPTRQYGVPPVSLMGRQAAMAASQQQQHPQQQHGGGGGGGGEQHQAQHLQAAQAAAAALALPEDPSEFEMQRRQKISQANKGRVPWNKGRKHPPEVIARIRAATLEAMQRPEVKAALAKANEKREPHTDEAKAKIRVKLRQRANVAREEINTQAALVVQNMLASEDPELQRLAQYERAVEVVAGLAWQYFKKDWQTVAGRGWEEHPEFRDRCIKKLVGLVDKKQAALEPKKPKIDKVKAALGHMAKLEEAQAKLRTAEDAMAKLQRAKAAFAGDPARLRAAAAAEEKASIIIARLRQQVAKLELALQPLQQYIESDAYQTSGGGGGGEKPRARLEQQLEAEQQQRQQYESGAAAQAAAAINGYAATAGIPNGAGGAAAPAATAGGELLADVGGAAPLPPASAAALPPRTALPWEK